MLTIALVILVSITIAAISVALIFHNTCNNISSIAYKHTAKSLRFLEERVKYSLEQNFIDKCCTLIVLDYPKSEAIKRHFYSNDHTKFYVFYEDLQSFISNHEKELEGGMPYKENTIKKIGQFANECVFYF